MIDVFNEIGIYPKGNYEEQKLKCPKCSPDRKNKGDKPLSINLSKGMYNCHHCGWKGNVKIKQKPVYTKPVLHSTDLPDKIVKYFEGRGISLATLIHWKVSHSTEFFPQTSSKSMAVNFNYFKEGELINIKYRDSQKNFKLVSGAELIFYGLDSIKDSERIYIVEGEIDALSFHEAGLFSVCSVPNGASKGNQKLDYLDNCWEYFVDKKEIILCTDNDEAGLTLRGELARRLGKYRCKYVDFGTYKDANEIINKESASFLMDVISKAKNFPLEGILNIDDIWDNVLNYNKNGIKNYSLGLGDSTSYLNVSLGEWTVCTGIPNSGKSDVVDQISANLALTKGFKTAFFAPESFPYEGHIKRIANKLNEKECDNETLNLSKDFIEEHFHFVKIDLANLTLKSILDNFRQLVFQKGVNICVIDPWNQLDHSEQKDHSYIGRMLSEITQFCQQTNTHLFLVAHPRKMESENGVYKVPTPYSISGSADFFNKAYNCMTVYRKLNERSEYDSDLVEVHIQKVKRKENGSQGVFEVAPDFKNGGGAYKSINALEHKKKLLNKITKEQVPF
jgi:twinkle protein